MTRVIFRKWKGDNEIIAVFPDEIVNEFNECQSYTHWGQHSPADYNAVIRHTKAATEDEYAPLLEELKYIGYDDLKIYKRK
jgi:hypothetical protein